MQESDLESIKQSAIAAYRNEEVPLLMTPLLLMLCSPDEHPGSSKFSLLDVKWRPRVTLRSSYCRVHIIIESCTLRDKCDTLPSRRELRLAIEQGSLRDCLDAAVHPLQGRYVVPGGYFFTWGVGSAMFADEHPLGEEDYMRPADIDADKPDPWAPRSESNGPARCAVEH